MEKVKLPFAKVKSVEGPEALISNGVIRLMFDTYDTGRNGVVAFHGLHYIERDIDRRNWSKMKKVESPIVTRHGQVIVNN